MKPSSLSVACVLALGLAFAATAPAAEAPATHAAMAQSAAAAAATAPQLHAAMRSLWHGHVVHTRDYALAVKAGDTAAAAKAADEVVTNAKQIADAVAGFYGADAGSGMLDLLAGHWGGVKAMTDAQQAGDNAAHAKSMQDLTTNADAIAKFLAGANPNLTADAVRGLLIMHIGDHEAQISQIMAGDMTGEATTWAHMQEHMNVLADALSDAIAAQFPDKAQ
jgi:hypothetical protein